MQKIYKIYLYPSFGLLLWCNTGQENYLGNLHSHCPVCISILLQFTRCGKFTTVQNVINSTALKSRHKCTASYNSTTSPTTTPITHIHTGGTLTVIVCLRNWSDYSSAISQWLLWQHYLYPLTWSHLTFLIHWRHNH